MPGLNPDLEVRPREGTVHVRRTHPGDVDFDDWLAQRHEYMQRMGWDLENEHDRYDDDPATTHILVNDERGKLIVGMRLTPVEDYQQSLSWEMLEPSPQMRQEVVNGAGLNIQKPVWDLTKLIQGDTRFPPEVSREAIGRLFGEGLVDSGATSEDEPTWVFAITTPLFRLLSANGMHLRELTRGRISPEDKTSSVFGYVRTMQDLRSSRLSSIAKTTMGVVSNG